MPTAAAGHVLPTPDAVLADAPDPLVLSDARERIRASHAATGRRSAVLDDDPTGSQTVHDVSVVMVLDAGEYAARWLSQGRRASSPPTHGASPRRPRPRSTTPPGRRCSSSSNACRRRWTW